MIVLSPESEYIRYSPKTGWPPRGNSAHALYNSRDHRLAPLPTDMRPGDFIVAAPEPEYRASFRWRGVEYFATMRVGRLKVERKRKHAR